MANKDWRFNMSSLLKESSLEGGMGRKIFWHAHLDIKGPAPFAQEEVQLLELLQAEVRQRYGLKVDDQPFNRMKADELAQVIPASGADLIELLAREDLYGAPLAHWTIMSSHPENSPRADDFRKAYLCLADVAEELGRPSYIEVERVRQEVIRFSEESKPRGDYLVFSAEPFRLVSVESLSRTFRDSEVHISFADMSLVDPRVFEDLFGRLGFRIACRYYAETGETSIIATAQGFEPDMSVLYAKALSWVHHNQTSGNIRCDVRLKWEEIIWHKLMNNPEVMPAIVPGSLISGKKNEHPLVSLED
jgi:hypothetical protein